MAKTIHGMSFIDAQVRASTTCTAPWVNLSGHGASVVVTGGDRAVGEESVHDGDTPIQKPGQRSGREVTVRFVYTEETTGPFEYLDAAYRTKGGPLGIEWAPKGGDVVGEFIYTTGLGIIKSFRLPQGEALPGEVMMAKSWFLVRM